MAVLNLSSKEKKASVEFKNQLVKKFGPNLVMLKLYGSKARGDFHEESDLDVLVVIRDMKPQDKYWAVGTAFDISTENDTFISPLVFSYKEWDAYERKRFSLARNVEEEGVKI